MSSRRFITVELRRGLAAEAVASWQNNSRAGRPRRAAAAVPPGSGKPGQDRPRSSSGTRRAKLLQLARKSPPRSAPVPGNRPALSRSASRCNHSLRDGACQQVGARINPHAHHGQDDRSLQTLGVFKAGLQCLACLARPAADQEMAAIDLLPAGPVRWTAGYRRRESLSRRPPGPRRKSCPSQTRRAPGRPGP